MLPQFKIGAATAPFGVLQHGELLVEGRELQQRFRVPKQPTVEQKRVSIKTNRISLKFIMVVSRITGGKKERPFGSKSAPFLKANLAKKKVDPVPSSKSPTVGLTCSSLKSKASMGECNLYRENRC